MVIVAGFFQIHLSDRDKVLGAVNDMVLASNKEAGCLHYGFYEDLEMQGHFRLHEEWSDRKALDRHMQTPHMRAFMKALSTIEIVDQSVHITSQTTALQVM